MICALRNANPLQYNSGPGGKVDTPTTQTTKTIRFETHPDRYRHWKLQVDGATARLTMHVREEEPLKPGYRLKLNSYDLGVDIELQDAVQRLRFEHPEVRTVVVTGGLDRVFCSGANIHMLGSSTHAFKVNFCKFTNETRLSIEDASSLSGQRYLAAINGPCAGGGYELAMACDEIVLVEDGNSAVSLPEVPLLGVLPGTGGLTRLVDKRKVRRDLADVFCTTAEGIKGQRAVRWGLVDASVPRSRFDAEVQRRAEALAADSPARSTEGVALPPLERSVEENGIEYSHVSVTLDAESRTATVTVRAPQGDCGTDAASIRSQGGAWWPLVTFRELDDALCHLRVNEDQLGLILLKTEGDPNKVLEVDRLLAEWSDDWFVGEVRLLIARALRRLDLTARSIFALIEPGSCFAGTLFEMALAADRSYMLDDPDHPVSIAVSPQNAGAYPMSHGPSRMEARFIGDPERARQVLGEPRGYDPTEAAEAGLVTVMADDIDYEDEVRLAIEERSSLSPDSLTGLEANLRFPGTETATARSSAGCPPGRTGSSSVPTPSVSPAR
jgi:benzoyl-CoA-dihydrodiol lyase